MVHTAAHLERPTFGSVLNELFDNISRVLADDEALKGAVGRLQRSDVSGK